MCPCAYLQLPISWRSHVGSGEVFEIVGGMQYAKLPLRSILPRESRNFILKTYIYIYISRGGMEGDLGRGPIAGAGRLKPDWNFSLGVSDIFHAGMFLSECTGTSGTIFECQPSLVWIISISRFKSGSIVSRRAKYHWHVHSTGKYFFSRRLIRVARSWIRLFRWISDNLTHFFFFRSKMRFSSGKSSKILVNDLINFNYVEMLHWNKFIIRSVQKNLGFFFWHDFIISRTFV